LLDYARDYDIDPIEGLLMVDTVIDISRYQTGIDLAEFAQGGGLAVIAKASQGTDTADPEFASYRTGAAAAGLAFASYHYLTTDDPATQAAFYLATAVPVKGERVVADWEAAGVTAAQVSTFLQTIQASRPDLQLTVYGDPATLAAASGTWLPANTSLWVAEYGSSSPSVPSNTWSVWSLWQYSDTGTVPGYSSSIDVSQFNGTNANLLKWFGPATQQPQPAALAAASAPTITVTVASSAAVSLVVNGVTISVPGPAA
jgi:lysozyme